MNFSERLNKCKTIEELNQLFAKAKPQFSLFGGRKFTAEGYKGTVRYNDILKKTQQLFKNHNSKNNKESLQLFEKVLSSENVKPLEFPRKNFLYRLCFSVIYSLKQFFGNWGRPALISDLTKEILSMNPPEENDTEFFQALEKFPDNLQYRYFQKHRMLLPKANLFTQKMFILKNPEKVLFVSAQVKKQFEIFVGKFENVRNTNGAKFFEFLNDREVDLLKFLISGMKSEELRLSTEKNILLGNENVSLDDIAKGLIEKIASQVSTGSKTHSSVDKECSQILFLVDVLRSYYESHVDFFNQGSWEKFYKDAKDVLEAIFIKVNMVYSPIGTEAL